MNLKKKKNRMSRKEQKMKGWDDMMEEILFNYF